MRSSNIYIASVCSHFIARLKGSLQVRIWPNHIYYFSSVIVYVIGSGQVNDLLGGNETLTPPWVSQPDGSIRNDVNTIPGRKSSLSQRPCVRDQGESYRNRGFQQWSTYTAWRGMSSVRLNSAQETP